NHRRRRPADCHTKQLSDINRIRILTLFKGAYGEYTIWSTLCRLGYRRYVACQKPIILEETRQAWLA
ncbi:hypothetical protein LZ31DRAFT_560847, partial [Colletotrichum somersetense]